MNSTILFNSAIPLILLLISIIIVSSDFIKFKSGRKVILSKRSKKKNRSFSVIVLNKIINRLHKFEIFNEAVDKGQFILGYFSDDSESTNRRKAESTLVKMIILNILFIIIDIYIPVQFITKCVIIFIFLLVEYFSIHNLIRKKQLVLRDSFHILVREFIEGYVITKNIQKAFEHTVKNIPTVYQVHVNRLITQLSSATGKDYAFSNFNSRIDYDLCSCFVSIVQSGYYTNKNIIDNLLELQEILNKERVTDKTNRNKLSSLGKNIWLWIIVCLIELGAVGYFARTSTGNYFLTTQIGQLLLIANIIFIVISIISMIIADSI